MKITPIFIFDGKHRIEKSDTVIERRKRRDKAGKEKLELLEEYKAKLDEPDKNDELDNYVDRIEKKIKQNVRISSEDITSCREMLEAVGIPCLTASSDGEELCAALNREKKVFAAYTTDSDVLTHGAPIQLRQIHETGCEITCLNTILENADWSMDEFIDFCITCGCDFNSNIKGVGPVAAWKLIDGYRCIENFPSHYRKIELDTSILKYKECREIFRPKLSIELCQETLTDKELSRLVVDRTKLATSRETLEKFEQSDWIEELLKLYKDLGTPIGTLV